MEPVRSFCKDSLAVRIYADRTAMGAAAARDGAALLRRLLAQQDTVRAVFAAAPSQNEFLEALCAAPDIDWKRVTHSTWMNMWAWMQRRPKASATFCAPACSTVCPLAKYAI